MADNNVEGPKAPSWAVWPLEQVKEIKENNYSSFVNLTDDMYFGYFPKKKDFQSLS
jgi:hypothetical protein